MKSDISTKLTTETSYFGQLIGDIKKGEIKIPQFQRKFVWTEPQALELLDSIANSFPIGSVLLWKTKDKLHAERNIGNFRLPQTDDLTPTNYVLDGQQRLTVIYSCLGASENEGGFLAGYDLNQECFVEIKENSQSPHIFPLRKLFNTTSLLNYRTAILTLPNATKMQERLDDLISAFIQYKLPVVTLKDLTIEEVCPIFERINSSGTKLSTYDLMVAATWNIDFDLNENVSDVLSDLESKGYGDTDRATVLKALSAIQLGSIRDKSLRTLRDLPTSQIEQLTAKTKQALLRAVDVLNTHFGVHSWDFLSYEAILLIITFIFCETKELSASQALRLRQWFWRCSFGERYKVGGEHFVSNDMETVGRFVLEGIGDELEFGSIPHPKDWGATQFRSNVARSRALILALASRKPRNLTNGMAIDVQFALSSYNKKEYHHLYPRSYLASIGKSQASNVLANIIMLTANSNKLISDTPPSLYAPKLVDELGEQADTVFQSNLLPVPSEFDYEHAGYEDFLSARGILLCEYATKILLK